MHVVIEYKEQQDILGRQPMHVIEWQECWWDRYLIMTQHVTILWFTIWLVTGYNRLGLTVFFIYSIVDSHIWFLAEFSSEECFRSHPANGSWVFRAEVYSKVSFASPKSHIFSSSFSPTKMFLQARSRWMTPLDIRNSCEGGTIHYICMYVFM